LPFITCEDVGVGGKLSIQPVTQEPQHELSKPLLVGIDMGTSSMKMVNPFTNEKIRVLSVLGDLPENKPPVTPGGRRGIVDNLAFHGGGRSFLLGESARIYSPMPRWFMYRGFAYTADLDQIVDVMRAVVAASIPFDLRKRVFEAKVIIGVPVTFDLKFAKGLKEKMVDAGTCEFNIENYATGEEKKIRLSISDMQVWYQSFGSLYSYCTHNNDSTYSGTVVDVGFGLSHVCPFETLRPIRRAMAAVPMAVGDVAANVRDSLIQRGGGADIPGIFDLAEILKEETPTLYTRTLGSVDLTEERSRASVFLGQDLVREVTFYLDKALGSAALSQLIITGGGGCDNFLGGYLRSSFPNMRSHLLNDIFANAEGLLLGAREVWYEESNA